MGSTGDEGRHNTDSLRKSGGPGGTLSSDGETMSPEHGLHVYFIGVG